MANDLNLCQFIGRLGKDPDCKYLANGDAVVNFSLAVGWKGKDKEGVEWVNVVAFQKLAEIISQYCTKGQMIYVAGRMRTRKWTSNDGVDKWTTEIVADQMQMLGSKGDDSGQRNQSPAQRQKSASRSQHGSGTGNQQQDDGYQFSDDSEIPF